MKQVLLLAALGLACRTSGEASSYRAAAPSEVNSLTALIDSLARVGGCPRRDLPPISRFDFQPNAFDSLQACGIVAAAVRTLTSRPPSEPYFALADTARIVQAKIFWQVFQDIAATGPGPARVDSSARVELDIRGRPRLVWVEYRFARTRETFGVVQR